MKKIITNAIIALAFIFPLNLQAQDLFLVSAEPNSSSALTFKKDSKLDSLNSYMKGLDNKIPESIEASMFNLLVLRLDYPYSDFSSTIEKLSTLGLEGETTTIRYKALITMQFINDPVLFLEVETVNFIQNMEIEKADQFYLALSKTLQKHITFDL